MHIPSVIMQILRVRVTLTYAALNTINLTLSCSMDTKTQELLLFIIFFFIILESETKYIKNKNHLSVHTGKVFSL